MKNKPLSPIEWTTLWMAIRYAMNGQTIACATLPSEIIAAYYHRLSTKQMNTICADLKRHYDTCVCFGNPDIDNIHWLKFWHALDFSKHETVRCIDDTTHVVFKVNDKIYPLQQYLENPHLEIYLPLENIKQ